MKITKQDIEKLALLSRIELEEDQVDPLKDKLESVLSYASGIAKISQENITQKNIEMPHNINVMRQDIVISTDPEPILDQAPNVANHFFVVPKIIKSE